MDGNMSNSYARYPNYSFLEKTTSSLDMKYCHTVVCGSLARDPRYPFRVIPMISFQNYSQSVRSIRADNSGIYNSSAVVGLDQLFRPYSIDQNQQTQYAYTYLSGNIVFLGSGLPYMPTYRLPSSLVTYSGSTSITSLSLHPFPYYSGIGAHDCEWLSTGSEYSGLHIHKKLDDSFYAARSIGFKSPMILTGWAYNIAGNPVPHASGDNSPWAVQTGPLYITQSGVTVTSSGVFPGGTGIYQAYNIMDSGNVFAPHAWEDCTKHPSGPIDLKWNKLTGTWQQNSMIKGKLDQSIPAVTGVADLSIWVNNQDIGENIRVKNWYSSSIAAGTKVMCAWDQLESYWFISSADCG